MLASPRWVTSARFVNEILLAGTTSPLVRAHFVL